MTEAQLIALLKKKLIPDLQDTSEMNNKDGYSAQYDTVFEFKCREKHYDTLIIDKPKYDHLVRYDKVRYICSTPKGIYSWNLKKLPEPIWDERLMRSSTWYHREVDEVIKKIGYLAIKDAKDLTKILLSK